MKFVLCSYRGVDGSGRMELEERLAAIVRASPTLMRVLTTLAALDLLDWWVASGAVYQSVWNALTRREADYGIKDYDVFYYDPDTSWDAEDRVIRRVAAAFSQGAADLQGLAERVEVRNQARVHLWFEDKFGEPYGALTRADEALERFVCPAFAVAVRLKLDGAIAVAAPFGLDDCFAMRLRPNPLRRTNARAYVRVTEAARARWPEVVVESYA